MERVAAAAGADPEALVGAMNEGQAVLTGARAELALLSPGVEPPPGERIEEMCAAMAGHVRQVFSEERSQHLLHDFYAAIGLRLQWHHPEHRLRAELETDQTLAFAINPTSTSNRGANLRVRGGT